MSWRYKGAWGIYERKRMARFREEVVVWSDLVSEHEVAGPIKVTA